MPTDKRLIQKCIISFDFPTLFREGLGWDALREYPISVAVDGYTYTLQPMAEKRGLKAYRCSPDAQGRAPVDRVARKIDREVTKTAYEHLILYTDAQAREQVWQWVKREPGKPLTPRYVRFHKGQSGEAAAQQLSALAVSFEEEDDVDTLEMSRRAKKAFDVERVTKKFYDRFQKEHAAFDAFVAGIGVEADRQWYTSLMLNRLMFIYFIQKQGLLDFHSPDKLDGDQDYLRHRLEMVCQQEGNGQFHSFYQSFLLRLFHEGLSRREHSPDLTRLLGNVPYLNGGLFDVHTLEQSYPAIVIPDDAFERIFKFFDEYRWHLDERPARADNEINPDVLGYIFEKYINQKQMGAYYTKEDITGYISQNTILPYLLESAANLCAVAFTPDGPVWSLLREMPDRYIYEAVKTGCDLDLPPAIEAGIHDIAQRGEWNKAAPTEYALPTETWREVVARRARYIEVRAKLASGTITCVNDLITYNLAIRQFAQDAVANCEGENLLDAFYRSLEQITILDPTCGSGAFLFAALNILEPLYEACLVRMQQMVDDHDRLAALDTRPRPARTGGYYTRFRDILQRVEQHPNRRYFILKSIIINNLYGVDIMEEATEICKLRLFLKLAAQIESARHIEPLPDIDFNIRAGNTLVGFATYAEVERSVTSKLDFDNTMERITRKAQDVERSFKKFREMQTDMTLDSLLMAEVKAQVRAQLKELNDVLNGYLAAEYGIDRNNITKQEDYDQQFAYWRQTHQPFHWFIEFYGIMQDGGFDVIIGNPPYVEYGEKLKAQYRLLDYRTLSCGNLHAYIAERVLRLANVSGHLGLIVPLPALNTSRMEPLQQIIKPRLGTNGRSLHIAAFDERPSSLFVGVDQRLAIEVFSAMSSSPYLATTGINRWASATRESLFELINYAKQSAQTQQIKQSILKIKDNCLESRMLILLYRNPLLEIYKSNTRSDNILAYRTAGGRYWKVVLDHPFGSESLSNKIAYLNGITGRQAVALISSSTFWWYYSCHFDMYNLKDYMIFGFRFGGASEQTLDELEQLGAELGKSLEANSTVETVKSKTRGNVTSQRYVASKSKPIIDEIDRVLAQHYGFTDEELDFIINYDIKYRMGRGDDDGEDEA